MRLGSPLMPRRRVLAAALGGVAGAALSPFVPTARGAVPAVTRLTADISLIEGAGGNVVALATSAGLVVVDTGAAQFASALVDTLAALPGGERVDTVFNTHWHLDQVGANEALGRAGATILAHEKTRLHLATDYYLPDEDRYEKALPAAAQPRESFYSTGERSVGGRRIEYGYLLEAHTDGDCYVHFTDANIIAVGDAVSPQQDPALDWFGGGWIGGRVDALSLLLEISDDRTRFVPSFGSVVGRAEVQAEHDLMRVLFERMVELVRQGMSPEDILAAGVMDGLDRRFNDPLRFVHDAHKSLWAHHNTLSHDIV